MPPTVPALFKLRRVSKPPFLLLLNTIMKTPTATKSNTAAPLKSSVRSVECAKPSKIIDGTIKYKA